MGWLDNIREKLNPAQVEIAWNEGDEVSPSNKIVTYQDAYDKIEVVNRGVNLIADSVSGISWDIKEKLNINPTVTVRKKKLTELLSYKPNPYRPWEEMLRFITLDLLLDGNAFLYWDGAYLYTLPANFVEIHTSTTTYVEGYSYNNKVDFKPNEIIHIKDNSSTSIYRGTSRLSSARNNINRLNQMLDYQGKFFENGTVMGLVLETPNTLGKAMKDRLLAEFKRRFNPATGARSPVILDSDLKVKEVGNHSFKELEFAEGIKSLETTILTALGIPPVLLDGGNNANISPNNKLFYTSTILPIVNKIIAAFEIYFGYDIKPVTQDVIALSPELKELGNYLTSLVNAGILTRNEARERIRMEAVADESADKLVLPANVAGSAQNAALGGRPSEDKNDEQDS